jgi:hypothetical protein
MVAPLAQERERHHRRPELLAAARKTPFRRSAGELNLSPRVRAWFGDYVRWLTTDRNGIEERDARNNHATCWTLQAAGFARLAGNDEVVSYCRGHRPDVDVEPCPRRRTGCGGQEHGDEEGTGDHHDRDLGSELLW